VSINDGKTNDGKSSVPNVTVLCGGVGAARLLAGLMQVLPAESITAIVNVADDTELHGLSISPDIDTIIYTLAGAIDPERGWGLVDETWHALGALERYESVRPDGSDAASRWFGLGDKDLASHFYRTQRRREGATLTEITAEMARAWGLGLTIVPMTDDPVRTFVTTGEHGRLAFQEFFVRHRHALRVESVEFEGAPAARPSSAAVQAILNADRVIIAPSNPLVSIGPILAIDAIDAAVRSRRDHVVAVSPIVGGKAIKGPADHMLAAAGIAVSAVGIAEHYRAHASVLVFDQVDAELADEVGAVGVRPVVTDTIMSDVRRAASLCRVLLK
jgi:LPPG:FO 2-phospho-L-lactate transferase